MGHDLFSAGYPAHVDVTNTILGDLPPDDADSEMLPRTSGHLLFDK